MSEGPPPHVRRKQGDGGCVSALCHHMTVPHMPACGGASARAAVKAEPCPECPLCPACWARQARYTLVR